MSKRVAFIALIAVFILAPLAFSASYDEMKAAYQAAYEGQQLSDYQKQLVEQFCEEYRNSGINELDETGGPDDMGYVYFDSDEDEGPTYDWIDISETGTAFTGIQDDNHIGPFEIGFDFIFYGDTYTQFYFQSNGTISFTDAYITLTNQALPTTDHAALIAWFWDDLNITLGGSAYYQTTTVNDMDALVISMIDFREHSDPGYLTAQVIMFSDGSIKLQYNSLDNGIDITSCTIGIQNAAGEIGLTVQNEDSIASYPHNELAIEFYQVPADAAISGTVTESRTDIPLEGVIVSSNGFTTTTDAEGDYELMLYPGEKNITFTHEDYASYNETVTLVTGDNDALDVALRPIAPLAVFPYTSFEDNDGCYVDASTTVPPWEWGTPTNGPGSAYDGDYCWATGLEANYAYANAYDVLYSPAYMIETGANAAITFYMWFQLEASWDYGYLYYRVNGGDWIELAEYNGTTNGNTWTEYSYTLEGVNDGDEVEFYWLLDGDSSNDYPGMFVDAVTVGGAIEPVASLSGAVSSGENAVAGATLDLYLAEEEDEPVYSTTSGDDGAYSFDDITPGLYDLKVSALGYYENTVLWVAVELGDNSLDVELDPVPVASIEDIQTTVEEGSWVTTTGIVTLPTNSIHTDRFDCYIQDATGYGVMLYDSDAIDPADNLNRGDEIQVSGQISEYYGVTELVDFTYEVLSTGNDMPTPYAATTGDMANQQALEGSWAEIMGALQSDPETGSYTVAVDDGSGAVNVYINEAAALDLSEFSQGDWIVVRGPIGLFQNAVQIVPSLAEDFNAPYLEAPRGMTATRENGSPYVTLDWVYGEDMDEFIEFIVFRDGNALIEVDTIGFIDTLEGEPSGDYEYWVVASYDEGMSANSDTATVNWDGISVTDNFFAQIPTEYSIARAYPNPFNPTMTAVIGLPDAANLDVRVFNILGKQVSVLAKGRFAQGYHTFTFDATDLSSGIYFIQAHVPGKMNSVRKVSLIR